MRSYEEAKDYLFAIPRFTKKNTQEDTRLFYENMGSPASDCKIIHVAGTNGKGSVCAYLSSVLRAAGYHVGVFTSPHLVSPRERFTYDGKMISREAFVASFEEVMSYVNQNNHPTFFEFIFFMAMVWFAGKKPDIIILETGLGGRLDATNCVPQKQMTIITEIGLDHMQYLGDTKEKIALEKAGIMRSGVSSVFGEWDEDVFCVLTEYAKNHKVPVFSVLPGDAKDVTIRKNVIDFSYHSRYYGYVEVTLQTNGLYQVQNALLALRAIDELAKEFSISKEAVQTGMRSCKWEGRMEEILPGVIADGAHNEDGICAFIESVSMDACEGARILLFSAVSDKRYEENIRMLEDSGLFAEVILATLDTPRGVPAKTLSETFSQKEKCREYETTREALLAALLRKESKDRCYIAGSLYLVGEVKGLLRRCKDDQLRRRIEEISSQFGDR